MWSQGASEGRGTCDWPPRVELKGSPAGAAQVELRGLIMHDHVQPGNGGAITTNGYTRLVIVNATFIRNTAEYYYYNPTRSGNGGAICASGGTLTIINAQFSNNVASPHSSTYKEDKPSDYAAKILGRDAMERHDSTNHGGAIFAKGGTVTITHAQFSNNKAPQYSGGAIFASGGTLTIAHAQFSNNVAKIGGGAIFVSGGILTITMVPTPNSLTTKFPKKEPKPQATREP